MIKDMRIGDKVINFDNLGNAQTGTVLDVINCGTKEGFKLTLQGGFEDITSKDHKFLKVSKFRRKINLDIPKLDKRQNVVEEMEWARLEDIKYMDLIALPKRYTRETTDFYAPWQYELLGYFIGDGCLTNGPSLSLENEGLGDYIASFLPEGYTLSKTGKHAYRVCTYRRTNPCIYWLREIGLLGKKSKEKFIPQKVLQASRENLWRLFSGLITTDGWIDKIGVGFCTTAPKLKEDFATLSKHLGLSFSHKIRYVTYKGRKVGMWQFHFTRKECLKHIEQNANLVHKHPKLQTLIKSKPDFPTHKGINKKYYHNDLEFARVISIESVGEVEMYDLEIDNYHNYIANNILSHNSAAGANELIRNALQHPKSVHCILAPNSKIMNNATLIQFWKFCPKEFIREHKKVDNEIYLINGAKIVYLTADNERHIDRLRGIEIGSFWADEAALFLEALWDVLIGRLRSVYGPLTGVMTTTPRGRNWIYKLFVKHIDPKTNELLDDPDNYTWFGGSTMDNPHTPEEYKRTLLAKYKGKFREQELFGKFTSYEGVVYNNFDHNRNIIKEEDLPAFKEVIGMTDHGFTAPRAGLIVGLDYDDRCYVIEEFYQRRVEVSVLGEWFLEKKKKYPLLNMFYADPSSPESINTLANMGLNIIGAHNQVMEGINFVYPMFDDAGDGKARLFILEKCQNLIEEISKYRYANQKEGKEEKEQPLKVDDHACFIAGTPILTNTGEKPIEEICKGDIVLTREGWKPILKACCSNPSAEIIQVILSNGKEISCTKDHPFWVQDQGWVRADALRYNYKLIDASRYVSTARSLSPQTNTLNPSPVHVLAVRSDIEGKRRVYALSVQDCHEYFAHGILVKNCDALRYGIFTHMRNRGGSGSGFLSDPDGMVL